MSLPGWHWEGSGLQRWAACASRQPTTRVVFPGDSDEFMSVVALLRLCQPGRTAQAVINVVPQRLTHTPWEEHLPAFNKNHFLVYW